MKIRKFAAGLILCCLMALSGCSSALPSAGPQVTLNTCAPVTPCTLPASQPKTNGDLQRTIDRLEAAWAICAAQVDSIIRCQDGERDAKAR